MYFKKGDTVKIIAGKDRGKTGKIMHVDASAGKISVDGINVYKKHAKPKRQGEKGEIVMVTRPFNVSNAMFLCSSCGAATRIGIKKEGSKKVRFCKKCGAESS